MSKIAARQITFYKLSLIEVQDKTLILIEARTNRITNELELYVTFNLITGVPH